MRATFVISWALAACVCATSAAPSLAQTTPAAADTAAAPGAAFEPGLDDRRQRYERPAAEKVAMVPVHVIRFPFQVLNYPLENWLIHRDPGAITVYAKQYYTAIGRHGFTLDMRSMGQGSGGGMALDYTLPTGLTGGNPVTVSALMTHTGYDQFALAVDSLRAGAVNGALRLQYNERPREDFYGYGPRSALNNRTTYQLDEWLAQVLGWTPLWGRLNLAASASLWRFDVGRGRDPKYPTLLEVFPPEIDGSSGRFEYFEWFTGLVYTTRDDREYARRGTVVAARVRFGRGLGGTPQHYMKYETEVQQFVPLWGQRRSLAMRLRAVITDNLSDEPGVDVPIFRLEHVGGSRSIRGYQTFRYQDKDALFGNFEYRFPIWNIEPAGRQALDGAAIFDFGTAVPDLARLRQHDMHSSVGLGLRLSTAAGFFGRWDLVWSPEGYRGQWGLSLSF